MEVSGCGSVIWRNIAFSILLVQLLFFAGVAWFCLVMMLSCTLAGVAAVAAVAAADAAAAVVAAAGWETLR